mgnify:CR=1 FL=1
MLKLISKSKTAVISLVAACAVMFAGTVVAGEGKARFKPGPDTIATIAVENGNFTTLVAALSCTGLVGAVADPDAELTVFAPNDAAFGKLNYTADNICSEIDSATLTDILLYHVVAERRPSPSVINGMNKEIDTLLGETLFPAGMGSLEISANNSTVNVVAADILASNGIIHVIDFVLLP